MTKKTICLCMIVKNEAKILKECFDSLVDCLDYWVICDTGSTDGTQELIKEYFAEKKLPGDLHEEKWVNFGYNRTSAFQNSRGKADYILVMDADDRLVGNLSLPQEDNFQSFHIKFKLGNLEYYRPQVFNNELEWKYVGVVHEYATLASQPTRPFQLGKLQNVYIQAGTFGDRSAEGGGGKFKRDIALLEQGIKDEPTNERYHFYLAQSYKDLGDYPKSIEWYTKTVELGGWAEEVYISLYSIGVCKERLGRDFEKEILYDYLKAFNFRKTRLEALYRIVYYFRCKQKYKEAFGYGMLAYPNSYPQDYLFIEKDVHLFKFNFEVSIAAYWVKFYQLAYDMTQTIIDEKHYPPHYLKTLKSNQKFSADNLLLLPPPQPRTQLVRTLKPIGGPPHVVIIQKAHMHTEVIPALLEAISNEATIDVLKQPDNWANWIDYYQKIFKYKFNIVTEAEIRQKTYDTCIFVSGRESHLSPSLVNPDAKIIRIVHWPPELHLLDSETKVTTNYKNIALCPFLKTPWALPVYNTERLSLEGEAARWNAKIIGSAGFQKMLKTEKDPVGLCKAISLLNQAVKVSDPPEADPPEAGEAEPPEPPKAGTGPSEPSETGTGPSEAEPPESSETPFETEPPEAGTESSETPSKAAAPKTDAPKTDAQSAWSSLIIARDTSLDQSLKEHGATIHHNLPTQTFSEKISKCTYLCTACPTRSTYRVDRLCGTIVLAISHGIPLIIDRHLANLYNIPKETSIFYDPKTFDLSMLNTQTEQSYLKMTEAMKKFKEKCFGDQKEQWQLTKGTVYNTIRT